MKRTRLGWIVCCILVIGWSSRGEAFDSWSPTDMVMQGVFATLEVIDWGQTLDGMRHPTLREYNPILGPHPSELQVDLYMSLGIMGHTAVSFILPKEWRRVWQSVWIGIEGGVTQRNYAAGIGFSF